MQRRVWRIFYSVERAGLYLRCSAAARINLSMREIARAVDAGVGAVQRGLENLSKVGLILRKSVGNQVFYQANRDTPIFSEMLARIAKGSSPNHRSLGYELPKFT